METIENPSILIVDDDKSNLKALEKVFKKEKMSVFTALNGSVAVSICKEQSIDVVLTDLRMPGMDGLDLLDVIKQSSPDCEIVLMTAYGSVESAVEAIKKGAYDFVEKPVKRAEIVKTIKKAIEKHFLMIENKILKKKLARMGHKSIIGSSSAFKKVLAIAEQAATSVATILICGESGTGKEVLARYIYDCSLRSEKAFVAVNCSALPESILEAELFGHEEGAFTGAIKKREGRFTLAHEGTIFLDEVAEMSPSVQVKLLRVLQERVVEPLGGKGRMVDVRVLAATNKDLEAEVEKGNFREDLFYRLNVIAITLPPLRQRPDDIPLLVEFFIEKYSAENNKKIEGISSDALDFLVQYQWPGNVRELENALERAVVLSKNSVLGVEDFPSRVITGQKYDDQILVSVGTSLEEIELKVIKETLRHTKGDKKQAAKLLGIATRTIYRKLD